MHLLIDEGRCGLHGAGVQLHSRVRSKWQRRGPDRALDEPTRSSWRRRTLTIEKGDTTLWTFPELLKLFYGAPLKTAPGESYLYTDATAILMGELVRRIAGANLDVLAEQRDILASGDA